MIIEMPNYVSTEDVLEIRAALTAYSIANPSNNTSAFYRDGRTVNVSLTPELAEIDAKLNAIFSRFQTNVVGPRYRPAYDSGDSGYEYHVYAPGDRCHCHTDSEIPTIGAGKSAIRYASVILQLNTIGAGGELIFPDQDKCIKAEAGKLVAFPPYGTHPHFVTAAAVPREVIVTWFTYSGLTAVKN